MPASEELAIRRRATIVIRKRSAKLYEVAVYGRPFWRKRALIQRFERRLGTWQPLKTVVLTDSERYGALGMFTVALPKGTRIRAVFPRSEAGPCYLTGTSNTLTA